MELSWFACPAAQCCNCLRSAAGLRAQTPVGWAPRQPHLVSIVQYGDLVSCLKQLLRQVEPYEGMTTPLGIGDQDPLADYTKLSCTTVSLHSWSESMGATQKARRCAAVYSRRGSAEAETGHPDLLVVNFECSKLNLSSVRRVGSLQG